MKYKSAELGIAVKVDVHELLNSDYLIPSTNRKKAQESFYMRFDK